MAAVEEAAEGRKDATCEVERGRRKGHWVVEGVERNAILQPDDPDWLRRSVGHAAQAQGHVGHHGHVLWFHREMRQTWRGGKESGVSERKRFFSEVTASCRWTHPPAGCCPPLTESGDPRTAQRTDRSPYQQAGPCQCCHEHKSDKLSIKRQPKWSNRQTINLQQQQQRPLGVERGRQHFLICSKFWVAIKKAGATSQLVERGERAKVEERD